MNAPNLYAFIDQAARIAKGLSTEEQMAANAELFDNMVSFSIIPAERLVRGSRWHRQHLSSF